MRLNHETRLPTLPLFKQEGRTDPCSEPVPPGLDYELWLGPAPWRPYREETCHYAFHFVSVFSGGQMTNWGAHNRDIVQWALDADEANAKRARPMRAPWSLP